MIIDPMLATGSSLVAAIDVLKASGCKDIRVMVLVAAPEGIKRVEEAHPDVVIFTAAIDHGLNENGYIVPGLGDAGDKILVQFKRLIFLKMNRKGFTASFYILNTDRYRAGDVYDFRAIPRKS